MKRVLSALALVGLLGAAMWFVRTTRAAPAYELVPDWPALPEAIELAEVAGVAVDSHDHVIVFHRAARAPILVLDAETGRPIHAFGDGLFERAHGLAVDARDHVWAVDAGRHALFEFDHEGTLLRTLGEPGVAGSDETHFDGPTDVAVGRDGTIYVSDGYGNARVVKLASDGSFVRQWGGKGRQPGQFDEPHGLALGADGTVYVADRGNGRIQLFDGDGGFRAGWGEAALGPGGRPWGLEFSRGRLFVIDGGDLDPAAPNPAGLTVLGLDGVPLSRWSAYGRGPGELLWGHDVAVGRDGSVYSVEVREGRRVQKFRAR